MNTSSSGAHLEDPQKYLPAKPLREFPKGRVIYDSQHPSDSLYLLISGRVKVARATEDGCETIVRIVPSEQLFGESAFAREEAWPEQAVALETVHLMAWSTAEIERQIEREPAFGIALVRYVVARSIELQGRIDSMALYQTPERVAIALLQLAGSLGQARPDGMTRVPALTHTMIAEFVGTSREVVTVQMNWLRQMRMVEYSRRHIDVNVPAMKESLRSHGVRIPAMGRELSHDAEAEITGVPHADGPAT